MSVTEDYLKPLLGLNNFISIFYGSERANFDIFVVMSVNVVRKYVRYKGCLESNLRSLAMQEEVGRRRWVCAKPRQ